MFEQLQDRFSSILKTLRGQGKITETNISEAIRDIRRSLLEADVNFKVAKAGFQKAINLNPKNSENYKELGKIYLQERNFEVSKLYFKKAIKINSKDAESYGSLGYIF